MKFVLSIITLNFMGVHSGVQPYLESNRLNLKKRISDSGIKIEFVFILLYFLFILFSREGSRTDDEVVKREEEAIKLDGLSVAEIKEMRSKAERHEFQAEVNRMMKLIINSLYRNKEV